MMNTPTEISPYTLIQEHLRNDPWKLLVACIMLNQTSAVQVKKVIWGFFEKWPDAVSCAAANIEEIKAHIKPLGLYNRRSKSISNLSKKWASQDFDSILDLPGIGKYAYDSYKMFCEGILVDDVKDKELKNYLNWAYGKERRP